MPIRPATEDDLHGILAIYNEAVLTTTAIWNDRIVDIENRRSWLAQKHAKAYPVFVAAENGAVLGYASFDDFRPFDGYRQTVEHSVYVASSAQRRGIGRALVQALFAPALALGKSVMIGGISADNAASLKLHAGLGFVRTAHMPGVGVKFGRPLDLVFMQKQLLA